LQRFFRSLRTYLAGKFEDLRNDDQDFFLFRDELGKTCHRKRRLWQILEGFGLKKLKLKYLLLDFQDYIALGKLTSLEKLNLPYPCDGGEIKTIQRLITNLPNLKKIVFTKNYTLHKNETVIGRTSLPPHEQKQLQEIFQGRGIEIVRDDSVKFGK